MVTGRWWEKNDGQTNRDFWRGSRGEKRCVLTPFANNGFMKKDFHLLGSCMGGHACALPLPHLASAVHVFTRKPSPRAPPRSQAAPGTARASLTNGHLPGKIGTVYGNSRHGRWPARRFWDVCWGLGLRRWRRLVLRISKEKDRAETAREKEARCTYASSPSTQDFCPESLAWGLSSREWLSARPSLPSLEPKKSTWSGGVRGRPVEGSGGTEHRSPYSAQLSRGPWGLALPCLQLSSQTTLGEKTLRASLMWSGEGTATRAAVYEPLRPRDKGHATETRAQDEKRPGKCGQG